MKNAMIEEIIEEITQMAITMNNILIKANNIINQSTCLSVSPDIKIKFKIPIYIKKIGRQIKS